MTKQDELQILDAAIVQLNETQTYLGPWLRQVRHEVEALMRSDRPVELTLRESEEYCRLLKASAQAEAARIKESAQAEAQRTVDAANRMSTSIRSELVSQLRKAIGQIS
jgi:F0F1-type ATP synthase membrane subunit b/b'